MTDFLDCQICGKRTERSSNNQKYCPECSKVAWKSLYLERQKAAAKLREDAKKASPPPCPRKKKTAKLPDWCNLEGKSLARVDAEAKAFGLSYGQYTAAVASGSIDQLLKMKGIKNPRKILSKIEVK